MPNHVDPKQLDIRMPEPFEPKDLDGKRGTMVWGADTGSQYGDRGAELLFFITDDGKKYLIHERYWD